MIIKYKPKIEDYIEFNQFLRQSSPFSKQQIRRQKIFYLILCLSIYLNISLAILQIFKSIILILTLISISFPFGFLVYYSLDNFIHIMIDRRNRMLLNFDQNKNIMTDTNFEINSDFIQNSTSFTMIRYKYLAIENIVNEPNAVYIFMSKISALIVPNRAFESERQKNDFFDLLNRYYADTQAQNEFLGVE